MAFAEASAKKEVTVVKNSEIRSIPAMAEKQLMSNFLFFSGFEVIVAVPLFGRFWFLLWTTSYLYYDGQRADDVTQECPRTSDEDVTHVLSMPGLLEQRFH